MRKAATKTFTGGRLLVCHPHIRENKLSFRKQKQTELLGYMKAAPLHIHKGAQRDNGRRDKNTTLLDNSKAHQNIWGKTKNRQKAVTGVKQGNTVWTAKLCH